jgi:glucosyl-3-phosphoglycerate phosphatase
MRIVLWRHGQTDWNVENRFQGHSDIPLNTVGQYQATHAAKILAGMNPIKIIASDLGRAQQTAQALANLTKLPIHTEVGLRETNGGNWEGKTGDENRALDPEAFTQWFKGGDEPAGTIGERRSEVAARAIEAINKHLTDDEGDLIVVTHGGTVRCVLGKILDLPMGHWAVLGGLSNASWSVIEMARTGWILVEHNAGSIPEPVYGSESAN